MPSDALRGRARTLPTQPGCYLWKGARGQVLYVGKAQDLRARTLQYFGHQEDGRKTDLMAHAQDLEFVATANTKEALVLEQTLIKRYRPPYNVLLTDDKKYPYIAITREPWPRVVYTRDVELDGTLFGPFPDAGRAKRVARLLNQTFRLRQCRTLPTRECLYFHLHQCSAPCIGAATSDGYAEQARAAQAFLKGRGADLAGRLQAEMHQAADEQRYERAAELRDLAQAVESVLERQRVDAPKGDDYDAVAVARRETRCCALVLWVRGGAVVGRENYFLNAPRETPSPMVLQSFLEQFYLQAPQIPREILLPFALPGANDLKAALEGLHAQEVRFLVPERGRRRSFVEMAETNAALLLEQEFLLRERRGPEALEALRDALALPEVPERIECFDVSHHAGQHTVASLVALVNGKPARSQYRRFRIRTTSGGDDPGAMREVVARRYARLLREQGADALPDLVVVDGGPTQVAAALESLHSLGLETLPLIGLAKREEEIWRPHNLHALRLDPASPALHLLQRARDEAHRFAIGYQGALKRADFIESFLDGIPGVGPERRRRLLTTFGSIQGLEGASPDQIAQVPGVPRPLAQRIHEAVRRRKTSSP